MCGRKERCYVTDGWVESGSGWVIFFFGGRLVFRKKTGYVMKLNVEII